MAAQADCAGNAGIGIAQGGSMRAAIKRNARQAPGAFAETTTRGHNDTAVLAAPQRSAANWFLDAACYANDGETDLARRATLRGLTAMRVQT